MQTLQSPPGAPSYASLEYVCSRITLYYSSIIDLRWSRSIHSCDVCPLRLGSGASTLCSAVHYGMCTPVRPGFRPVAPPPVSVVNAEETVAVLKIAAKDALLRKTTSNGSAGEPASTEDNFLRRKEAQLKERRAQQQRVSLNVPSPNTPSPTASEKTTKDIRLKPSTIPTPSDDQKKESTSVKRVAPLPKVVQDVYIEPFYFPAGKPPSLSESDVTVQRIRDTFSKLAGGKASLAHMKNVVKACGLPMYWKALLFNYAGGQKGGTVPLAGFLSAWKRLTSKCHEPAAQFVELLAKPGSEYLTAAEFLPLLQDIVDTHPGLSFLQDAPEFHSRYIQTVISRIFYCVNRSWTGRITVPELRSSNFLRVLNLLEDEEEINLVTEYFSYEHFYVIYCKFWALDDDHDLLIDRNDLAKHNDHAISSRMIDRVFSGAVTRCLEDDKMAYKDFVWFLISEEDKHHPRSVEYWFRCMDLDGDGVLSMYELEYFYVEQLERMEALGIETLPFEDCLCQMLDMVRPATPGCVTLRDLKACKLTPYFFNTFFNLEKYLEQEQRDPFANVKDLDSDEPELSDWVCYAAEEYEILVAEEGAGEVQREDCFYEDDFEPDTDEDELMPRSGGDSGRKNTLGGSTDEDIYDFSEKTSLGSKT